MVGYHSKDEMQSSEAIPEFHPESPELIFFDKYQPRGLIDLSVEYMHPKKIKIKAEFRF